MRPRAAVGSVTKYHNIKKKSKKEYPQSILTKIRFGQRPHHLYAIERQLTPKGPHILLCLKTTEFDQSQ